MRRLRLLLLMLILMKSCAAQNPTLCESMDGKCQIEESECLGMNIKNQSLSEKYCNRPSGNGLSDCCAPSGKVFIADIENALSFSLRNTVLFENTDTPEHPNSRRLRHSSSFNASSVAAYNGFLGLLVNYLKPDHHIQKHTYGFIKEIHRIINKKTPEKLKSKYLLKKLMNVQNRRKKYFISPSFQPSVSCHKMGHKCTCGGDFWIYTCGLWNILHTLTHALPEKNDKEPLEMLIAIKEFVINWQGCPYCEHHYWNTYNTTLAIYNNTVNSREDAILWLWCTHNSVNQRFTRGIDAGDIREFSWQWGPPHPKFPLETVCPGCWSKTTETDTTNCSKLFCDNKASGAGTCFQTFDDPGPFVYHNFYKHEILKHLRSYYTGQYSDLNTFNKWKRLNLVPHEYYAPCPIQD